MKKLFLLSLLLFLVVLLVGCRKSSQSRGVRGNESSFTEQSFDKNESTRSRNRPSPINNKRSSKKLEGQEIFDRYATAVFMVFTSDGMSNYQGSGFFINNYGLAVSNYHVLPQFGIIHLE